MYHTADPIAMGTCNGILSSCALGGYAMESRFVPHHFHEPSRFDRSPCRCHLGKTIVYDTVSNLSWSVDVRTHGIVTVIEKILGEPWRPSVDAGREVPKAVPQEDCVVRQCFWVSLIFTGVLMSILPQECYHWEFDSFPARKKGWWW